MNKQQRRKDHKKSYTKAFMEAFKNMSPKSFVDEGGRAKPPTSKSTPIVDKILYKKRKR